MQQKNIILFAIVLIFTGISSCSTNSIKDIDGNNYKTVTIGKQIWMAENLKTTRLKDGTIIPVVIENDAWIKLTAPSYCWYFNDEKENKNVYGGLYNWYAVNSNKLCPEGWHVPSDAEWMILDSFLDDMRGPVGGKLKEKGTGHWKIPNSGATNESGFTALPGGYRSLEGVFNSKGIAGYWWSSTEYNATSVYFWTLRYKLATTLKYRSEKFCGFSVRCIKDN